MKIYRHFPAISLWGLFMILTLAVLCSCNKNLGSQQSDLGSQELEQSSIDGVWHTGEYVRDVEPGEYCLRDATSLDLPRLDNHAYKMYRVCHNGSCGFRAFIPIMLSQLLEGGKWKKWMEDMKNTIFSPAQAALKNRASQIENTKYPSLAATNDPEALYQKTMQLFEHLAQEGAPRKLQEAEIQILVDFLRQTVLMYILITQPQEELQKCLEDFYKEQCADTYGKEWWIESFWFGELKLPFCCICTDSRLFLDLVGDDTYRDTNTRGMIVMFHHDRVYYDYLVQQEG